MKKLKIIYYAFLVLIGAFALLLIFSLFPVTGNYKLMVVQSESMKPAMPMGSLVVMKPVSDYKVGDVISFTQVNKTKTPISHRIHEIKVVNGETVYITKGDANEEPDARDIKKGDIMGKVLFTFPYLGYAVTFAKKPYGFLALVIIPAVIIIFDQLKNIYFEVKKMRAAKKAAG